VRQIYEVMEVSGLLDSDDGTIMLPPDEPETVIYERADARPTG
jgi:hypothetical protein